MTYQNPRKVIKVKFEIIRQIYFDRVLTGETIGPFLILESFSPALQNCVLSLHFKITL